MQICHTISVESPITNTATETALKIEQLTFTQVRRSMRAFTIR